MPFCRVHRLQREYDFLSVTMSLFVVAPGITTRSFAALRSEMALFRIKLTIF